MLTLCKQDTKLKKPFIEFLNMLWKDNASSEQGRNEGGAMPRAPNHYGGAKSLRRAPKSFNNVATTFLNNTRPSERPQVRTWGCQTCFLA